MGNRITEEELRLFTVTDQELTEISAAADAELRAGQLDADLDVLAGHIRRLVDQYRVLKRYLRYEAPQGCRPQMLEVEVMAMLEAAGYGQNGEPNTLWAMVKACVDEVKNLRADVEKYQGHCPGCTGDHL